MALYINGKLQYTTDTIYVDTIKPNTPAGDVVVKLDTNDGTSKFDIQDSGGNTKSNVTSNGDSTQTAEGNTISTFDV